MTDNVIELDAYRREPSRRATPGVRSGRARKTHQRDS
jgi:hypothetical protein